MTIFMFSHILYVLLNDSCCATSKDLLCAIYIGSVGS